MLERADEHRLTAGEMLVKGAKQDVRFDPQRLDPLFGKAKGCKGAFKITGDSGFRVHGLMQNDHFTLSRHRLADP